MHRTAFDTLGEGRPIVLLHALAASRSWFVPQRERLSHGHHLILPDLPGHGALAEQPFTFEAAARVTADVITQAANGPALVGGISMGAYVAICVAAHYAERVAGLVLSGCGPNFRSGLGALARTSSVALRLGAPVCAPVTRLYTSFGLRRLPLDVRRAVLAGGHFFQGWPHAFRDLPNHDFYALLARYRGPVLILNGERDFYRPWQSRLAAAVDNAHVQVVRGAGHIPNVEAPDAYNEAVLSFADAIDWEGPRTSHT